MRDSDERRRDAASYAISIVLHLGLIYFFLGAPGVEAGGAEPAEQAPATAITITRAAVQEQPSLTITRAARPAPARSPAPQRRPQRQTHPVVVPPPVVERPAPAPTSNLRIPATQRELAKIVKHAPVAARSTPAPSTVAALASAAPLQPAPPTAPPTIAPTADPDPVPPDTARIVARAETPAPTPEPTAPPTAAPTRAPAPVPTVAPTSAPTIAPTRAPTAAPTTAPTRAPTAAPTVQPTAAPRAVEPTSAPRIAATAAATAPAPSRVAAPGPTAAPARSAGETAARAGNGSASVPAAVALAQPTNAPAQRNAAELLNERLRSLTLNVLLPRSDVNYSQKHYGGDDIAQLGQRIEHGWEAGFAPPAAIVPDIFGIVRKARTDTQPDSVTYLYKRGPPGERLHDHSLREIRGGQAGLAYLPGPDAGADPRSPAPGRGLAARLIPGARSCILMTGSRWSVGKSRASLFQGTTERRGSRVHG